MEKKNFEIYALYTFHIIRFRGTFLKTFCMSNNPFHPNLYYYIQKINHVLKY